MIGYLKGKVQALRSNSILINVNGIGYELLGSGSLMKELKTGSETEVYVQTEMRDSSINLFGFVDENEKEFFNLLLSVPGLGPKTALSLMSFSVKELKDAIFEEDMKKLTSIPGLGKKTVQRLILELKRKLPDSIDEERSHGGIQKEVYDALTNLGYARKTIENVLKDSPLKTAESEELIRFFLQNV